jgi:hypothetical protein
MIMSVVRNWAGKAAILLLPLGLGACAQTGLMGSQASLGSGPYAWDGAGPNPNAPQSSRRSRAVAVTQSSSNNQAMAADTDAWLARKLVICSTCVKPQKPQDTATAERSDTARVAANR